MADGYEVRVTNGAEFSAAMAALAHDMADLRAPLEGAGAAALAAARAACPRRTGTMASAHRGAYTGRNTFAMTVDHPGAAAVHWGWPAHGIERQPWMIAAARAGAVDERLGQGVQEVLDHQAGKVGR